MTALSRAFQSARRAFRHWNWRRNIRNQSYAPLNAWGYHDIGYW